MSSSILAVSTARQKITPGGQVGVMVLIGVCAYTLYRQGFRFYAGLREIYFLM